MTLDLSQRINRIKPSATIAVTELAAQLRAEGKDIVGLAAGEPDFDTPDHISKAAHRAIHNGFTKYTAVDGIPELKEAIIAKFERDNELAFEPDQIIVSNGAKQCIFNLCQVLLDTGDEVVVPAPYWVSYRDIPRVCGARIAEVFAGPGQDFLITPEQLEKAINEKTRLLMLNSPCNPTGATYTRAQLAALGEVLEAHENIVIMTDEIYEHVYWGEEPVCSFATANPGLRDRTVVVNGVSKAYAMTGWRIGYAGGPVEIIRAMNKIQGQSTSCASSISQAAAVEALNGDQSCVEKMTQQFRSRHDFVVSALSEVPDVSVSPASGTFYAFPDMRRVINHRGMEDDLELGRFLLNEAGVALVSGSAFGAPGFMRVSYATDMASLKTAMQRLNAALSKS